jgi:hypothetical protein
MTWLEEYFAKYTEVSEHTPTLWKEHRFRVFENRVPRTIFGPKREDRENCIMKSSIICVLQQILLG